MKGVIHYSGGLFWRTGNSVDSRGSGFTACVTGAAAYRIKLSGRQTRTIERVTCAKCLRLIKKAEATGETGADYF